jgi:hypothetical protein
MTIKKTTPGADSQHESSWTGGSFGGSNMTANTSSADTTTTTGQLVAPKGLSTSAKKAFSMREARSNVATLEPPTWLSAGEFENMPTSETDWVAAEANTERRTSSPWRQTPTEWAQAASQVTAPVVRPQRASTTEFSRGTSLPSGVTIKNVLKIRRPMPERARIARRVYAGLADLVSTIGVMWAADELLSTESMFTKVKSGVTAGGLADRGANTVEIVMLRTRPVEVWMIMAAFLFLNSVVLVALTGRSVGRWLAGVTMRDRMTLRAPGFTSALTHLLFAPMAPAFYYLARRTELQATPTDRLSRTVTLSD